MPSARRLGRIVRRGWLIASSSCPPPFLEDDGAHDERDPDRREIVDDVARVDDAAGDVRKMIVDADVLERRGERAGEIEEHLVEHEKREDDEEADDERHDLVLGHRRAEDAHREEDRPDEEEAEIAADDRTEVELPDERDRDVITER